MPRQFVPSLLAAAVLLSGCDEGTGPLQTRENAFAWSDHMAAGSTLLVRSMRGDIVVAVGTDDTARVTARLEWRKGDPDETLRLSGSRQGEDALICAVWGEGSCSRENYNAKMNGGATDAKVHFTITVPAGVKLDLMDIDGDVTASASAPVKARTMNGDVRVATSVGPVDGESLNGSVDIRMSSLSGADSVKATTLNGDAFIYLPDPIDALVDLGVTNGSVSTEFPVTMTGEASKRSIRGALGAGGRTVHARSMNGEVALRRLRADGTSAP